MTTRLTVVVDNVATGKFKGEWGLSLLLEYGVQKILVDCGASELFAANMEKLGLSIEEIDYGVLSHAHFDHANGVPYFFAHNDKAKFYLRDVAGENCYSQKWFFFKEYIGIPKKMLETYRNRLVLVSGDYKLCDGVYLVPHKTARLEEIGRREKMYVKTAAGFVYDDFSHEQSVVIETAKGLVIINSCCHGGAANIIREVQTTFPGQHIYGIIGGFHLYNKSKAEVQKVAQDIKATGIEYVCTGHCTEERAYKWLKEELGSRLQKMQVGLVLDW
ncbi:MBL fold metallo-hydrolase [Selenomonas ruminis]|uniref:MBL fold metallo-hydrolase n=2 Tax=Selenomonas ruminis TaxID=2593411 RepID=A0A5D6WDR3_9FIRM|nr:MBL fold metallo-hydrolase [Selenomonas sp. mPRGC5]